MTAVDPAACGLGRDKEIRLELLFLDEVLPAHAVAVLLHDSEGEIDGVFAAVAEFLEDASCRDHACSTAFLVGGSASVYEAVLDLT